VLQEYYEVLVSPTRVLHTLHERLLEAAGADHDGRAASAVAAAVGDGGGAAVEAGGAEAAWFSRINPC
jgi:hypothetical protein